MLHTAQINLANSVTPNDLDVFLDNASWAICSTYHTVPKASPGAAIFGWDMLFDMPFIAGWNKIGDCRQHQTDLNTAHTNKKRVNYGKIGDKVLVIQDGILRKAQSPHGKKPWNNNGSYEWNYQDSMWFKTGKNKYLESNTLY